MTAPSTIAVGEPAAAEIDRDCATLLRRLRLTAEEVMSEGRDSFLIVRCRDEAGRPLVLKYVAAASRDEVRRLRNEALLVKGLPVRAPLRLLPYRDHGPGYLLTEFDPGRLLGAGWLGERPAFDIADALIAFQAIRVNPAALGVIDSDSRAVRYLKVLSKHIVHLWPAWLSAAEAVQCVAILVQSMPAILRRRVVCHGDFLPTNLLYHAEERTVTITDLERFASADHPLFDVLALLTAADGDITRWDWQRRFLHYFLAKSASVAGLRPRSREFRRAYRGILMFFLVYRLSEARVSLANASYFDGRGKGEYMTRKLGAILRGHPAAWQQNDPTSALRIRTANLRRVLSPDGYREHLDAMQLGFDA